MKRLFVFVFCLCFCCSTAFAAENDVPAIKQAVVSSGETLTVPEDLSVFSDETDVTALSVTAGAGETPEVTVSGSVSAECRPGGGEPHRDTKACGVLSAAQGEGAVVSVTVDGGISAASSVQGGNTGTDALIAEFSEGGFISARIDGDITVESGKEAEEGHIRGAGVSVSGSGGSADIMVDGNVQVGSAEYGVGIHCRLSGDRETFAKVRIGGDLTASTLGIFAEHAGLSCRTEVIVDGTVRGGDAAILLSDHPENALITVWKAEPNAEGRIIRYMDDGMIEEPEEVYEKKIRYILRTRHDQHDFFVIDGAEEYEGFPVACEGEKVSLSLQVPGIYEPEGVYADAAQAVPLEQDESSRYILEVPKGGGVEFSVKFKNAGDYARLITDLYLACLDPAGEAAARIDTDVEAAGSPVAVSLAECWRELYLDPDYPLLLCGADDPAQLHISRKHAFVVLGFELVNGEMTEELKGRCAAAAAAAQAFPDSILLCTGGATGENNPEGHTEAGLMKAFLAERYGIDPERIFTEESAMTTAENARNSLEILQKQQVESMTVITSSYHQKRAQVLYRVMAARFGMEKGWPVKVIGNYNYSAATDEAMMEIDPLLAFYQICEILRIPEEQMDWIREQIYTP